MEHEFILEECFIHSLDKELAKWLPSENCGQQLNVKVETSDKGYSLRISAGTSVV